MNKTFIKGLEIGVQQALKMFSTGKITPKELVKGAETVMKAAAKVKK